MMQKNQLVYVWQLEITFELSFLFAGVFPCMCSRLWLQGLFSIMWLVSVNFKFIFQKFLFLNSYIIIQFSFYFIDFNHKHKCMNLFTTYFPTCSHSSHSSSSLWRQLDLIIIYMYLRCSLISPVRQWIKFIQTDLQSNI